MSSAERSAAYSDSLDKAGHRVGAVGKDIVPMTSATTVSGRARTVQFVPAGHDSDSPYDDAIDFIDSLEPGDVVVISTQGSHASAVWGELFTAAAKGRGAAGLVTDGAVRDIVGVRALDWPVFATGTRPVDYRARQRMGAVDVPVTISGVPVSPGDRVVADDDGVVIVPADRESEIVELVRQRAKTEATVLEELLAGSSLREVWERYRVL